MTPADPAAVSRRFAELVIRAQAQAAREEREHLAAIRATREPRRRGRRAPFALRRPMETEAPRWATSTPMGACIRR